MFLEGVLVDQSLATLITLHNIRIINDLTLHHCCLPGIDPGALPITTITVTQSD